MLELILTRPSEKNMIEAARGLRYLVLDELHTYRGRQGADVAHVDCGTSICKLVTHVEGSDFQWGQL